jgi:hypothetical protein
MRFGEEGFMHEFPFHIWRRVSHALSVATLLVATAACHQNRPATTRVATHADGGTVFTDSVTHAQMCEPPRTGEDWRKVCIPLDQGARPRKNP